MKVKLTRDWADFKKGQSVEIVDKSVLIKGFESELFDGKAPKELFEEDEEDEEIEVTKKEK